MKVQLVVKNVGKQQGLVIPVGVREFVIGREPGGFSSYRTQFQDKLRDDMFVRDKGALSL